LLVGGDQVVAADHEDGLGQDVQLAEYILHSAVAGHLDLATGIAEHDLHWTSFGVYRKMSRMTDHRRPFPFDGVVRMVETSQIVDAMTVVAVLHAAFRR